MTEQYYDKLTKLMLFAVDFQKGDKLYLGCDFDQRDAALRISAEAYKRGAAYVHLQYADPVLQAQAIAGTQEEFFFPAWQQEFFKEITQPGWKYIVIASEAEAHVFDGLDVERSTSYFKAFHQNRKIRMKAVMDNKIPWSLTYLPSAAMSKKAFPDLDEAQAIEAYWKAIIPILRLDLDDPEEFWRKKMAKDRERATFLESLKADFLHFKGPGTDLKVGLAKAARWIGGFDTTLDGKSFMANIPTDEIFTSPDWRQVNGRVALTKPFVMHQNLGPVPQDAWFEFKDGKVVDYGAREGQESLDAFFNLDERARYIGEVALVDPQSPFAAPGITYYNGLYDENAACHIALGKAYPFTLKNRGDYSDAELTELGLNCSTVHEDMMIGSKEVSVIAHGPKGETPLIKDGKFLI